MCQQTSGGLYIVYVLYISAEQYSIDVPNVSNGGEILSSSPTSDIHYPIELDEPTASDRLHITQELST